MNEKEIFKYRRKISIENDIKELQEVIDYNTKRIKELKTKLQ